tara:strand:- start:1560 stop:1772 length:213 start_codon:yes stop_codon:yes gene_type:complete
LIDQFFSNADYYKNEEFQKLMRAWKTIESKTNDPEILQELYNIVKFDFYRKAKEWLKHNYDDDEWKYDLE